jgi:tRNA-specific 2-thiouridylase
VVGGKSDLAVDHCEVDDINWIGPPPAAPFAATVKVRYRSPDIAATVAPRSPVSAAVQFSEPVSAVTPGQGAVFYDGGRVLGGGWIMPEVAGR